MMIDRINSGNREVLVDFPNRILHILLEPQYVDARSPDYQCCSKPWDLLRRHEHFGLCWRPELLLFDVARYADYFMHQSAAEISQLDFLPDRLSIREEASRKRLIHDCDWRRAAIVAIREIAAAANLSFQHVKVVWRNCAVPHVDIAVGKRIASQI